MNPVALDHGSTHTVWGGLIERTGMDVLILFWEDHEVYRFGLPPALRRLGHRVWMPSPQERGSGLARRLAARRPDLVFSMGWTGWSADLAALASLRDYCSHYRVPHIYWSTEDPLHTAVWVLPHINFIQPDAVLTISPRCVAWYRQLGIHAEEMPFAAAADLHKPLEQPSVELVDVAVVATLYGNTGGNLRNPGLAMLLRPLVGQNWTVRIWGHGWETSAQQLGFALPPQWLQPPVPYQAVPGLYNTARLVLGPQNDPNQLTSRTFEAVGTGGGPLLTLRTPGVARYFREDDDLLAAGSSDEAARLMQKYLTDADARRRISKRGRRTVLAQHTYDHRAAFIISLAQEIQTRPAHRTPSRILRQTCRLSPSTAQTPPTDGPIDLLFDVPPLPGGYDLVGARLECFADSVPRPGMVLCVNDRLSVLDAQYISSHDSNRYPYTTSWVSWDVLEELKARHPNPIKLSLVPDSALAAAWIVPGATSTRSEVGYHFSAFLPRVSLLWTRS